jgi:hypothetical protein
MVLPLKKREARRLASLDGLNRKSFFPVWNHQIASQHYGHFQNFLVLFCSLLNIPNLVRFVNGRTEKIFGRSLPPGSACFFCKFWTSGDEQKAQNQHAKSGLFKAKIGF